MPEHHLGRSAERQWFSRPPILSTANGSCASWDRGPDRFSRTRSGISRSLFQPRVVGGQWGARRHWEMRGGPASRLRDVLDRAGVRAGAVAVRFKGLQPVVDGAPDYMKSLDLDHARDGEVMLAFEMNSEQLPLLNGFPLRLVVPGLFDLLGRDAQRYRSAEPINLSCSACQSAKPQCGAFKVV